MFKPFISLVAWTDNECTVQRTTFTAFIDDEGMRHLRSIDPDCTFTPCFHQDTGNRRVAELDLTEPEGLQKYIRMGGPWREGGDYYCRIRLDSPLIAHLERIGCKRGENSWPGHAWS